MKLKTRFDCGETPLSEYPRPQLVRDNYVILNGLWDYAIVDSLIDTLQNFNYIGQIKVPFSVETPLSLVEKEFLPNQTLVYRKFFKHKSKGKLPILHFDAVDYKCFVYLNGKKLGEHTGGYFDFSFNIKEELLEVGDNELIVLVQDPSDTFTQQRGKQKLEHGGIWYTPTSGIWQSVWIENVPQVYIDRITLRPNIDDNYVEVFVAAKGEVESYSAEVTFEGKKIASIVSEMSTFRLKIKNPKLWSPENPQLYDISISVNQDEVKSYFAMRKFELKDKQFYLNNKPYFLTGVLDQGYWPDGGLTPPSDEAMKSDILLCKELGLNTIRKHIKIEPLRWYYHCDKIGMIVWQDMINGGGQFNNFLHIIFPTIGINIKDNHYKWFGRDDDYSREEFKLDLGRMVKHLYNCPSICLWGIFNEAWGQFDSEYMREYLHSIDPTRALDATSGWYNQGNDLISIHKYILPFKMPKTNKAVALTEFGGYSYAVKDHVYSENKNFGYLVYKDLTKLNNAIKSLYEKQIIPAVGQGLNACIYTQLSDVENEINGLITYDREVLKIDKDMFVEINKQLTKNN